MNKTLVAVVTVAGLAFATSAQVVPDRPTLQTLLPGGIFEDFETLQVPTAGQISDASGLLNFTTTFNGQGPGLVQPGANYRSAVFFWNGDGYFGLNTRSLGDANGDTNFPRPITIEYTAAVTAMGFDIQGYSGYSTTGTISVYDTANNLLHTQAISGGFFGYQHAAGIGSVHIQGDASSYIMIDNHLYGVPTPGAAALLGLGGLTAMRRRR